MGAAEGYRSALSAVLRSTAAAYGYTLAVATTVTTLIHTHGEPGDVQLYLFIAGGIGAFVVLEVLVGLMPRRDDSQISQAFPLAGALNLVAVGAAFGMATLLAHTISGAVAWLVAPFAATGIYLALSAGQATVVGVLRRGRHGDR